VGATALNALFPSSIQKLCPETARKATHIATRAPTSEIVRGWLAKVLFADRMFMRIHKGALNYRSTPEITAFLQASPLPETEKNADLLV